MDSGPLTIPPATPAPEFPPTPVTLPSGDIHVWIADLDRSPPDGDEAAGALLDEGERARADRLAGRRRRVRFVRSRALLRVLLGGYLGVDPRSLRLGVGAEGKPHLLDDDGRPRCDLRFNLSHTAAVWALAVRRDAEVGVDVERVDRRADVEGVARRMFAPGEREALARLDQDSARLAFFRVWSTREALVKCLGAGMFSLDLEFEVEADPRQPLAVRSAPRAGAGPFPLLVGEIPLPDGHGGVLATRGKPRAIRTWTTTGPLAGG